MYRHRLEEHYSALAHHYSHSGNASKALDYLQRAGQQAVQRSARWKPSATSPRAWNCSTGSRTLPSAPNKKLAMQISLGAPLLMTKGYAAPEVGAAYSRARELCQQVGQTPQLCPVLWGLWMFYFVRGELQTGRTLAEQLLHLAQSVPDSAFLLEGHMALGAVLLRLGEGTSARSHLEQGLALYDPQQHRPLAFSSGQDPGVACLSETSSALWVLGFADQAQKRSQEALILAQEVAHPFSLAFALSFAAIVHQYRREVHLQPEYAQRQP